MYQTVELTGRRVEVRRSLSVIPRKNEKGSWLLDECRSRLDADDKNGSAGVGLVGAWSEGDIHAVFFLDRKSGETASRFVQECDMSPTDKETTMVYELCQSNS